MHTPRPKISLDPIEMPPNQEFVVVEGMWLSLSRGASPTFDGKFYLMGGATISKIETPDDQELTFNVKPPGKDKATRISVLKENLPSAFSFMD